MGGLGLWSGGGKGRDDIAARIRHHLVAMLQYGPKLSPRDLVAELDREIGVAARWDVAGVLEGLREDPYLTPDGHAYIRDLLADDALVKALRGEGAPDHDVESTIDDLLRRSRLYRNSQAFREMLAFMAAFRRYSPYNNMLVRLQNPSCTYFATARHWEREFGRTIKEDARPMLILAPMGPVMTVYDLDSTTGPPLPEELTNFAKFEGKWDPRWIENLTTNAQHHRIRVDFKPLSSTHTGSARVIRGPEGEKFRVVVHDGLKPSDRFGTLCHEMAHILLGHLGSDRDKWWPARSHLGRQAVEIEAEATAYIVTRHLGLEGTSAEYLSSYVDESGGIPKNVSCDMIAKVAGRIEKMALGPRPAPRPRNSPRIGSAEGRPSLPPSQSGNLFSEETT